jgi:hypothetical protein
MHDLHFRRLVLGGRRRVAVRLVFEMTLERVHGGHDQEIPRDGGEQQLRHHAVSRIMLP